MPPSHPPIDLEAAFADHDRLFKELLVVFFADFLKLFLPQIAARIDPESVTFLNQESFLDIKGGRKRVVDLLVQARLTGDSAAGEIRLLFHIENQSKVQSRFSRRMFHLFARLHEKHDLPVYPVAIFSFDRPLRPEPNTYHVAFPGFEPLRFQFHAIQLNRLDWRDFRDQPNPVAAALMAKMHIAPEDRPKVKLECLRLLATLRLDPARTQIISGFIDSYLQMTAAEAEQFAQQIEELPQPERETVMPLTISWKEEGRAEGRAEGEARGRAEEARRLLVLAGKSRLGLPSPAAQASIDEIAGIERLEALVERLHAAETWDDLLRDR